MTTITSAAGGGSVTQNADVVVIHNGFAWRPTATTSPPGFGWFSTFPGPASAQKWLPQVDQPYALTPATAVVRPPFGWFGAFLSPASAQKWLLQVDQPYALKPPVTTVAGGPIAEGGFATVIQRYRAIGY